MSSPWIGLKGWRLRTGITEAALVTVVRDEIVPHYRALDPQVALGLLRSDRPGEYIATQTWPSRAHRERVCSGDRYARWFEEYLPILARFDALVELVDERDGGEIDSTEIAGGAQQLADLNTASWTGVELLDG